MKLQPLVQADLVYFDEDERNYLRYHKGLSRVDKTVPRFDGKKDREVLNKNKQADERQYGYEVKHTGSDFMKHLEMNAREDD